MRNQQRRKVGIMKLETTDEESKIDYQPIENRALA